MKRRNRNKTLVFICLISTLLFARMSAAEISRLTVDARPTPVIGTDTAQPEFAWELTNDGFYNVTQLSYSITVASSKEDLDSGNPNYWDSGEIATDKNFGIPYRGKKLDSSKRYYYQVKVKWRGYDENDKETTKTDSARGEFVTAVMNPDEWQGKWITSPRENADPLPCFYRTFELDQEKTNVSEAYLHICGLGQQIAALDSKILGERTSIDPGWTNYKQTCQYVTFDVKDVLSDSKEHSISAILGNGMYNVPGGRYVKFTGSFGLPKLIAQLVIRYKDGTTQTVCSDEQWKTFPSPITFSCVYGGDDLDFSSGVVAKNRIAIFGVAQNAQIADSPGGILRAQIQPPVVVIETLQPLSVTQTPDGKIKADFGFNFAGRPVFRCLPKDSEKIQITLAETPEKPWNGHSDSYVFNNVAQSNEDVASVQVSRNATSKNETELSDFEPKAEDDFTSVFGYWGFQYAYFDGADFELDPQKAASKSTEKSQITKIEADRIGANLERFGSFESDGAYLNDIELMIDRSVRSNIVSLFTDCPHREKLGWLEETHLMGPSILYRYNLQTLYRKICRDMSEAQLDDGMIPDIAPEYTRFSHGFFWSPEWSSACVQVPWLLYRWYGDEAIISSQYETMDKYVRYTASTRDERGLVRAGLGDWYDWSPERRHAGDRHRFPLRQR